MVRVCWTGGGRASGLAAAVAVVLAVTACGSRSADDPARPAAAAPAAADRAAVHCPTTPQLPAPQTEQPLPEGFTTAWVLRCGDQERAVSGQGRWWFRIEERADTDAAELMAALRRPDAHRPPGTVCPGVLILTPYFALVDASGTAVRPRVPRDTCGQPQREARDALQALPFRETAATRLHQEQSQASIDTGCGQMWTDAFAGDTLAHTRPAAARRIWSKTPDAVRICRWRSAERGMPQLESARTVSGRHLTALLTRLDRLPAAGSCGPGHQRFAVLEYLRRGWHDGALYAGLDGCRLVLRPDHTLGQLDPATAELITTLSRR
jgi:hypothetical protein